MEKEDIKRHSLKELREKRNKGLTKTKPDAPVYQIDARFWDNAELVIPAAKKSIHLRLDKEVLDWFKAQGPGHLTRMNAVLQSYYKAQKDY